MFNRLPSLRNKLPSLRNKLPSLRNKLLSIFSSASFSGSKTPSKNGKARPEPVLNEIGGKLGDLYQIESLVRRENPDIILRSESGGRGYQLFEEMELKDPHIFACLQTRRSQLLAKEHEVLPADTSLQAHEIASFVRNALDGMGNINEALFYLLDAIPKGFSVVEIMWEIRDNEVLPARAVPLKQDYLIFDRDNRLRLLTKDDPINGRTLPDRKFILFTHQGSYDNPYGNALLSHLYYVYLFKKYAFKFWVSFSEKFGSPTAIGHYPPGTSESDQRRLREVLDSIQQETSVIIPEGIEIELLEAQRASSTNTYYDLIELCNAEISKAVLGQTLTTFEGLRSSSYALAKIHNEVRKDILEGDARSLMEVINSTLIRWIVEFNFGIDAPAPRWRIKYEEGEDLKERIEIDERLVKSIGLNIPPSYFHEKYGIPSAQGHDEVSVA